MALYPFTTAALTSLTATGTTNSIKVNAQAVTFQVTASSVGTNVQVRFEGSLDDTNFFNLDDEAQDTTISADGTTGYSLSGTPVIKQRVAPKHLRWRCRRACSQKLSNARQ